MHQDARASFDEYRPVIGQPTRTARLLRGLVSAEACEVRNHWPAEWA
ncbi:hypothetical protein AB0B06_10930 [Streptomyces sp. NPDC044989]